MLYELVFEGGVVTRTPASAERGPCKQRGAQGQRAKNAPHRSSATPNASTGMAS